MAGKLTILALVVSMMPPPLAVGAAVSAIVEYVDYPLVDDTKWLMLGAWIKGCHKNLAVCCLELITQVREDGYLQLLLPGTRCEDASVMFSDAVVKGFRGCVVFLKKAEKVVKGRSGFRAGR